MLTEQTPGFHFLCPSKPYTFFKELPRNIAPRKKPALWMVSVGVQGYIHAFLHTWKAFISALLPTSYLLGGDKNFSFQGFH